MNNLPTYKNGKVAAWENTAKNGKPYIAVRCSYLDIFSHFEQVFKEVEMNGQKLKIPTGEVKLNLWYNEERDKQQPKK